MNGAGGEFRDPDLDLTMVPLFLLSYAGVMEPEAGDDPATCGLRNRCSASVSYPGAFFDLARAAGFEPATKWLTATYSTAEPCPN